MTNGLRYLRSLKGMTLKAMARRLNLSVSYVSEIEQGLKEPSLEVLRKYAEVFETRPAVIFFFLEEFE